MPESVKEKFSLRTQEINAYAAAHNITDPVHKSRLGAMTRERKIDDIDRKELEKRWDARLTPDERKAIKRVESGKAHSRDDVVTARSCIDLAIEHELVRESAVPTLRLLETALKRGIGQITPEQMKRAFDAHPEVITAQFEDQSFVTTHQALKEEREMIAFARDGRGQCVPLQGDKPWEAYPDRLNTQQRAAVEHVLTSQDRVMMIRGGAGTGKTTLMRTSATAIEVRGHSCRRRSSPRRPEFTRSRSL